MKKIISFVLTVALLLNTYIVFSFAENTINDENETAFSLESLPDIGEYVSSEIKEYFYKNGPLDEFKVSDEYGKIVPYTYVEGVKKLATEEGQYGYDNLTFADVKKGFATKEGKIITNPIFGDLATIYDDATGEVIYFLAYLFKEYDENGDAVYDVEIIGGDGSWSIEWGYMEYFSLYNFGEKNYLASYSAKEIKVYDLNGNKLFGFPLHGIKSLYDLDIHYINDECVIITEERGDRIYVHKFDTSGNILNSFLLENYTDIHLIRTEDVFVVASWSGDTNSFYFTSSNGDKLLYEEYDSVHFDARTRQYIAYDLMGSSIWIFDETIKVKERIDVGEFEFFYVDGQVRGFDITNQVIYDFGNNIRRKLITDGYEIKGFDSYIISSKDVFKCYTDKCTYIYSLEGQLIARLIDASEADFSDVHAEMFSDKYIVYENKDGGFNRLDLKTGKLNKVNIADGYEDHSLSQLSDKLFVLSECSDILSKGSLTYDVDSLKVVTTEDNRCESFGDVYSIYTETYSSLVDASGKVLLKIYNNVHDF